ncbi:MAG TPA: preprotein translocase subunit YajC [Bdellovibrionales bacterium]|nr:preprotein translocase subunit YajC [Bdellovibrionales bacterium]
MFRISNVLTTGLVSLASVTAFAQAAPGQKPSILESMFLPALMLVVVYFFIMRPQMKRQKDHKDFVSKLERGTEVITNGGMLGKIEGLTDLYVTLEIAPNTRIRVLRTAIAGAAKNVVAPGAEVKA